MGKKNNGKLYVSTGSGGHGPERTLHFKDKDECPALGRAHGTREVEPEVYPNRNLCDRCTPEGFGFEGIYDKPNGICSGCGGDLDEYAFCDWCYRYEEVMGEYA